MSVIVLIQESSVAVTKELQIPETSLEDNYLRQLVHG